MRLINTFAHIVRATHYKYFCIFYFLRNVFEKLGKRFIWFSLLLTIAIFRELILGDISQIINVDLIVFKILSYLNKSQLMLIGILTVQKLSENVRTKFWSWPASTCSHPLVALVTNYEDIQFYLVFIFVQNLQEIFIIKIFNFHRHNYIFQRFFVYDLWLLICALRYIFVLLTKKKFVIHFIL